VDRLDFVSSRSSKNNWSAVPSAPTEPQSRPLAGDQLGNNAGLWLGADRLMQNASLLFSLRPIDALFPARRSRRVE